MEDLGKSLYQVIGVVLVKNEDLYVRTAIQNILSSCDEVLVFDHQSTDSTREILEDLESKSDKVQVKSIQCPSESHREIERFVGTRTWIFAVDADEVYDPARTKQFCDCLREGKYSEYFQIRGNVLHVDEWNRDEFCGFFAPPSRAMNKMFNFSHLRSWTNGFERLHGGLRVFQDGFNEAKNLNISDFHLFYDSPFRCLHLVFLRRSSLEKAYRGPRLNIADMISAKFGERLMRRIRKAIGLRVVSPGKLKNYRLGARVRIQDEAFHLRREF